MNSIPVTFSQIFGHELADGSSINAIEIPIIQRDYAQGRETKEVSRIRNQFIDALFKALTDSNEDGVKLDFIYGNIEEGKLIPLDGQQRLTTLFLLHWYIAKHEGIPMEDHAFLKNFTYKTRFSSQHYCDKLISCTPDFENDMLSDWIMDQNWFMYSWEKDPTIKSMLVMIDKIHETFKGQFHLWKNLLDTQNPPISFYFLPLEEMGVTDSLYIKMNSRGKPLTPFEHFKADFEKIILEVSPILHAEFIKKVDVDWVDMLWKYRGDDDVIDDEFMKYYRFITEMICFQQEIEILENDFELSNSVYGIENENAEKNLNVLFKSFDKWKELGDIASFFNSIFTTLSFHEGKVPLFSESINLFSLCCHNYGIISGKRRSFSLNNTLLLFAVQQYLLNSDVVSVEEFTERIRIIRNLVFNSTDEVRESRLQALLADTSDIIVNGEINTKTLGYSELQKKQELDKIVWRSKNAHLINELNELEDHKILQGNISIIGLEKSQDFKWIATNFMNLFNGSSSYIKISRALLTLGDYAQLSSWRFMFGNSNDSTWRELFSPSKKRKFFENTKDVLLQLLQTDKDDMSAHITNLLEDYLKSENKLKDWKYYLIKYPQMREGKSGIYYWPCDPERIKENQYQVYMMNTPQTLNGRHWNPFLYVLSKSEKLMGKVGLEEYGALMTLTSRNQKVACLDNHWAIYDSTEKLIHKIIIKQENGTDLVDRIEVLEDYLTSSK